ncbi:MAG: hypothetical protein ACRDMH_18465 [Solirubrobacterales bacterium]
MPTDWIHSSTRQHGLTVGVAIVMALFLGFAAIGCGNSTSGSTSTTTTSTTAISKAQFLVKANAICTLGNKTLNKVGAKLGNNSSQAQITAAVRTAYVPSIQAQINGIRSLGAPSGDEATVTNMLNIAQADLNKIKADPTLLVGKQDQFANFAKIAHPYGLTRCAPSS